MGTGKTFVGAEKMRMLGAKVNLVVCQKSKVDDWFNHFVEHYGDLYNVCDLTKNRFWKNGGIETALNAIGDLWDSVIFIVNYDLVWRRSDLQKLRDFTLMLDESSLIQNENTKRTRFILKMKPANVVLLSGTPTGGKYENLWSQMRLLGWDIPKRLYWNQFIIVRYLDNVAPGRSIPIVTGYKNVDRLKRKMREHGCNFLKTDEVFTMPEQTFITVKVDATSKYKQFSKDSFTVIDGSELVGDTTLTKLIYERELCGQYNKAKLEAFRDLVESTEDRLIVFYNFTAELEKMGAVCGDLNRPYSTVNGMTKDLFNYEQCDNAITFVQYQAGAMGLNLQKANKIIYFTPPLSSELFEQSKKRIHRIGQERPCFYYLLTCKGSIEERIYKALAKRQDYTEKLFKEGD